jgi:hypothetical protein
MKTNYKILLAIALTALVICFVLEVKKYMDNRFEPILNHSQIPKNNY